MMRLILAWFASGLGILAMLFWLTGIFIWTSPDGEWTQADAAGMGLSYAFLAFVFLVLPGIVLLRRHFPHEKSR